MMAQAPRHLTAQALTAGIVLLMVAAMVLILGLVLAAAGFDVALAFEALLRGAGGSSYAIFSATFVRAVPLMLTGLAVAIAFQGGILNIGAEGQLLAGAAAATTSAVALGDSLGSTTIAVGLLAAAAAGAAWAAVPALLKRRFGVLEVISTIMMNFIAIYTVGYLVRGPLQEPTHIFPQSATIPLVAQLPLIVPGTRLHAGFIVAVTAVGIAWYVMRYTAAGFRLRVAGANPAAAASAGGVNVAAVVGRAFLVSGLLAGIAGGVEVYGVTYALYENLSPGYGYTAIAVALLAGLQPAYIVASAIFFGALEAGAASMQREAGVPLVLVSVVEAMMILAIVGGRALWARQRAASVEAGT